MRGPFTQRTNSAHHAQTGFTLIEVVIAVAILSLTGIGFVGSMGLAPKILLHTDLQETAKDIAQAQMEYVENQNYDSTNNPPVYQVLPNLGTNYPGYSISTPMAARLDKGSGTASDTGIQQITITVQKASTTVFTLVGQKVKW